MSLSFPSHNYFRPYVTWALNGHVTKAGLARQLISFTKCGYGGVMIQPWGGTPYAFMSNAWLERVAWAVGLAEKHGMGVWLWDDWLFPSGFAGGVLGKEDRHKSKKLKILMDLTLESGETAQVRVPPRFLAAGVVSINKNNNPDGVMQCVKPSDKNIIRWRATKRSRLVVVGWEMVSGMRHTVRSHSRYLQKDPRSCIFSCEDKDAWSVDMLNSDTTREYLQLIHEKYWRRLEPHFGKTIHGFFYDEPHLPTIFPWTPGLNEIFLAEKGYAIEPFLAPLLLNRTNMGYDHFDHPAGLIHDEKLKNVLTDYHDVWTSLLAKNFYGVIQKWCHLHGVLSIGHMGSDESLRGLFSNGGMYFKNMDRVDMPGVDVIWGQVKLGKFNDFPRFAGSRASLTGKPFTVSESFAVQGHGTYPDEMRFIMEHQIIRGVNHFIVEVASYNPKKSFYFHPPEVNPSINLMIRHYGKYLHQRIERVSRVVSQGRAGSKCCLFIPTQNYYRHSPQITDRIDDLAHSLAYHQREFDYAWDDDLFDMTVQGGLLVSAGGQSYREILIPSASGCGRDVLKHLKYLQRKGGRIILIAPAEESLKNLASVVCSSEEVFEHLGNSDCPVTFSPGGLPISVRSRQQDDGTWASFLLNESLETQRITLKCLPTWFLQEEDLVSQQTYGINNGVCLEFAPGGSRLIFSRKSEACPTIVRPQTHDDRDMILTDWRLKLPNGKSLRLRESLPSWHELGFGTYSGVMGYTARFRWEEAATEAILDLGELRYAATVFLDQQKVGDAVFTPFCLHLKGLTRGWHTMRVDVLNTLANSICGTEEHERQLVQTGAFIGTYAPLYLPLDRMKILSGMLGPVVLRPLKSA